MVCAEQPALEQAGDAVDLGHDHVRGVAGGGDVRDDVLEAVAADVVVAAPRVAVDLGAAGDMIEYELGQGVGRCVGDAAHPHASRAALVDLDADSDERLAVGATAAFAWFHAADKRTY